MAQQTQKWSVTVCIWTAVVTHSLQFLYALKIQYPALSTTESLPCECKEKSCQAVYWYRYQQAPSVQFQFLFYYNNAEKYVYGSAVDKKRYACSRRDGSKASFFLKISSVQEGDVGVYSCLIQYHNRTELGSPGFELRPGEKAPTPPPPPTPPKTAPPCRCPKRSNKKTPQGCGRHILWPLVGVLLGLAVVLIATLYYFSRLPKKCRHRLTKKKQIR